MNQTHDFYGDLSSEFSKFHSKELNICLHLITTPLGALGFMSLINQAPKKRFWPFVFALFYLGSLVSGVPKATLTQASLVVLSVVWLTTYLNLSLLPSLALLISSYLLQDLAHSITGEKTFQSTYTGFGVEAFAKSFLEHTYYLIPLLVDCSPQIYLVPFALILLYVAYQDKWFPWQARTHTVVRAKFTDPKDLQDLAVVRKWAVDRGLNKETSHHWWQTDLTGEAKAAYERLSKSPVIFNAFKNKYPSQELDLVGGMNELYVAGPSQKCTSDTVFYTKHIDGPFVLFPFAAVFRVLVALDENTEITTLFPVAKDEVTGQTGDVFGFDFDREVHFIRSDGTKLNRDYRIVMKLHYCVYRKELAFFGILHGICNTLYNIVFRALFLGTIKPKNVFEQFAAWNVVFWTKAFYSFEEYFGYANLVYLLVTAALSLRLGYTFFLCATSFVNYMRYINTYYFRKEASFGLFKRDAIVFKAVGAVQLYYAYAKGFVDSGYQVDLLSLAMIAIGYFISLSATAALGVDKTYFGWELGVISSERVRGFPYNVVPHPMILGQVLALCGFHKPLFFRQQFPLLVPAHVAFYLTHMLQEHLDIHQNNNNNNNNNNGDKKNQRQQRRQEQEQKQTQTQKQKQKQNSSSNNENNNNKKNDNPKLKQNSSSLLKKSKVA